MNRHVLHLMVLTFVALSGVTMSSAQPSLVPRNAQSVLYFPHLTEGGPDPNNCWQVVFNFVNTNHTPANLSMSFYNDDGSPMMLDFGSGPAASLAAVIPPMGSQMFRSQLTHQGPQSVGGWAAGQSDAPVLAQMNYRNLANAQVTANIAADATTGTALWTSTAAANMGIAVANPSPSDMMNYTVDVRDAQGNDLGSKSFTLPAHGHDAFNLGARFGLPASFSGSVAITGQTANPSIYKPAVWTVGWDSGAFATLPDGRALMPGDQMARAQRVFGRIMAMAHQLGYTVNPTLTLLPGTAANGIANATGGVTATGSQQVTVYLSLVEMTGDSNGELAFVMAHEIAHVIQCVTRGCKIAIDPQMGTDYESDADETAMMLATSAGYDSYGGAAMYAKLQVGNGQVSMGSGMMGGGTATVWEDITSSNPQGFFAGRINLMYQLQQRMCTNPSYSVNCPEFRNLMHPSTGGMHMPM